MGILRLSQALARLRLSEAVDIHDVDEALRLMECSKHSLIDEEEDDHGKHDRSTSSEIFRIIKKMSGAGGAKQTAKGHKRSQNKRRMGRGPQRERDMDVDDEPEDSDEDDDDDEHSETLSLVDIRARVLRAGFSEAELMNAITQVWLFFSTSLCPETNNVSLYSTNKPIFWLVWPMVPRFASSNQIERFRVQLHLLFCMPCGYLLAFLNGFSVVIYVNLNHSCLSVNASNEFQL